MNKSTGFTFIELLIVIWIIAVLAAVAIPAYSDYLERARAIEGLILGQVLKRPVSEYYQYHGRLPADNQAAGTHAPEHWRSQYVQSIAIVEGQIQVNLQLASSQGQLHLSPQINADDPLQINAWHCTSADLPAQYLPTSCK